MPTPRKIEFFNIARTQIDRAEARRWLDHIGATEFEIPEDGAISEPALLIALAAKRCYMSFQVGLNPNVTRVREDYVAYFDNILASGHGSVLEHSVYTFALEGVSRVFTAEMNRHRAGWAISEGSLRFIRFGENIPYWPPDSVAGPEDSVVRDSVSDGYYDLEDGRFDYEGLAQDVVNDDESSLEARKHATRIIMHEAFRDQERAYRAMERIWDLPEGHHNFGYKKKVTSMLRRIVGLGVSTGGVWSGNIRALRHVLAMRCSPAAEEEILHVFSRIAKWIRDQEPLLFGDFHQDDQGYWRPQYVKV